jgi:hypothetical protein
MIRQSVAWSTPVRWLIWYLLLPQARICALIWSSITFSIINLYLNNVKHKSFRICIAFFELWQRYLRQLAKLRKTLMGDFNRRSLAIASSIWLATTFGFWDQLSNPSGGNSGRICPNTPQLSVNWLTHALFLPQNRRFPQ